MIKAVFFDLDDTLENWDNARSALKKNFSKLVENRYGIPAKKFWKEFVKAEYSIVGHSRNPKKYARFYWLKKCFGRLRIEASDMELRMLEKEYWNIAFPKIRLHKNAEKVLKKISAKKVLITDSDDDFGKDAIKWEKIRRLGIKKYFDIIVTSTIAGKNKPSTLMWKYALKKLKVDAKNCIMIGDKPEMDLKPAKSLGMKTIWAKSGNWASKRKGKKFNYVDYKIRDIEKVIGIYEKNR